MLLYDTLDRKKREFKPLNEDRVNMYYCGMTLQESPHVGHIRAALTSDVLGRYLEFLGYNVRLIVNFTDVDDKVIIKAREEGRDYREIALMYENEYREATGRLNIRDPYFFPRATQHIEEIINFIGKLEDKDMVYNVDGNVYFRVRKFNDYGKLSGKKLDDLRSGARVEVDSKKEDPLDFAVWKAAKTGEPFWLSPWGRGRPGWHIECSAMATHYLGETLDIHGGGSDLIFPHHENEIAQSESATGKRFANFWVHNEMLTIKDEKMSKSLMNFIPVNELMNEVNPNAIRLYLLQAHYRKQLNYNRDILKQAEAAWDSISNFLERTRDSEGEPMSNYIEDFETVMNDDMGTPAAIALVFDIISESANAPSVEIGSYRSTVSLILRTLGFELEGYESKDIEPLLKNIIELRNELRKEGKYEIADRIREALSHSGIKLEDTSEGTIWRMN